MMTLNDVAKAFGVTVKGQNVLLRVRKLEAATGRRILIERGVKHGRRYLVNPEEFASALHGLPAPSVPEASGDIADLASKIADTVEAMNERHTEMSLRLERTQAELAAVTNQLREMERRLRGAVRAI